MDLFESRIGGKTQLINNNINNNNNNNQNDSNIDINNSINSINNNINSYSMPTTTNETFGNIGGLTQTTATLTPTTLKNIEESFMDVIPRQPQPHQHQAGFVPPLVNISSNYSSIQVLNLNNLNNNNLINNNMNSNSNNSNSNSDVDYGSDYETDDSSSQSQWNAFIDKNNGSANNSNQSENNNKGTKLNGNKVRGRSGRKPIKNDKLTPEEEKKRQQRRERNKQAAARCRKRRMDHTNCLLIETDGLEEKRQSLQQEIELLRSQKKELEFILETHKTSCKINAQKSQQIDIKPVVSNGNIISMNMNSVKSRPNSLSISSNYVNPMNETGIPIQTPSTGLFLDSLSEGGTGLTPILNASLTPSTLIITPSTYTSSTCGIQLKSSSSPSEESPNSKKLVHL